MLKRVPDLAKARVLISNDDGIDAPGLEALEKAIEGLVGEIWVVAPETEQSGAGHSLTLRRPLRIRHLHKRRYAVDGTPTDCVLLAVHQIMKGNQPDLLLSGVNRGGNLGEDVTYSGTVAAAMEGTLLGVPSIALSLVVNDQERPHWPVIRRWLPRVVAGLSTLAWPEGVFMNVNFPSYPADEVCGIETVHQGGCRTGGEIIEGLDAHGVACFRIGPQPEGDRRRKGTDLEAVNRGAVAVTAMSMDLTHKVTQKALKAVFP